MKSWGSRTQINNNNMQSKKLATNKNNSLGCFLGFLYVKKKLGCFLVPFFGRGFPSTHQQRNSLLVPLAKKAASSWAAKDEKQEHTHPHMMTSNRGTPHKWWCSCLWLCLCFSWYLCFCWSLKGIQQEKHSHFGSPPKKGQALAAYPKLDVQEVQPYSSKSHGFVSGGTSLK